MDVVQARTFLAIVEAGNFSEAAKRVYVTQSTVSARIRALEDQLGKPLFNRSKGGCELTPAGHQFYRFARSIVRVWEEARHQVALPAGYEDTLIVGGQYALWNRLLLRWVQDFRDIRPKVAVKCEIGMPQRLMREMSEGVMDMAVLYTPERRPGMVVEELLEDRLIMVTSRPDTDFRENYVFVDWGDEFRSAHSAAFPEIHNPGVTLELGALGVNLLLNMGASGYFPERVVQSHLDQGLLTRVDGVPDFSYPAFVVYQEAFSTPEIIADALSTLKSIADKAVSGALPAPYWVR